MPRRIIQVLTCIPRRKRSIGRSYTLGVSDGNASGITYAQANYSNYNLYTEAEKNASTTKDGNASGISYAQANYSNYNCIPTNASDDGNYPWGKLEMPGISYAQANYSSYNLYTEAEKNASDDGNYTLGVSDGNASGSATLRQIIQVIICILRRKRTHRMMGTTPLG